MKSPHCEIDVKVSHLQLLCVTSHPLKDRVSHVQLVKAILVSCLQPSSIVQIPKLSTIASCTCPLSMFSHLNTNTQQDIICLQLMTTVDECHCMQSKFI